MCIVKFYNRTMRNSNFSINNSTILEWEFDSRDYKHVKYDDDLSNIDWSNFSFPNEKWINKPYWEISIKSCVMVPIILCGIFANSVLFNLIIRNRPLRTATNILMANLFIADLITLIISPWMVLCKDFFQNYILGECGCKLEAFITSTLLLTDVFGLCAVSYDRLTAVVLPQMASLKRRGSLIVALATWSLGTIFSVPFIFYCYYKERQWKDFLEKYCKEDSVFLPIYWNVMITFLMWLPLGVTTICYVAIFIKLDRYEHRVLRREHPLSVNYKTKVLRMLFVIVISTLVCRLPFTIMQFIRYQFQYENKMNQVDDNFRILWLASHYLIFISSALTPFLYGMNNEKMRASLHLTFFSRKRQNCCPRITRETNPRSPGLSTRREQKAEIPQNLGDGISRRTLEPREACYPPQSDDPALAEKFGTLSTDCYL